MVSVSFSYYFCRLYKGAQASQAKAVRQTSVVVQFTRTEWKQKINDILIAGGSFS